MDAQDSIVIALTRYVLDGPGIKSQYGRAFIVPGPVLSRALLTLVHDGCPVFYRGKEAGRGANNQLLTPKLRMG
jgi:hypothetical protein